MVNKSKREKECFEKVLKCSIVKGDFAKSIYQLIANSNNTINFETERPDIIINSANDVIGIEHYQVDVLFKIKRKTAHSMIQKEQSTSEKLVDKYKDEELLDRDIKNGEALNSLLSMVKDRQECKNSFSYQKFIENFERISKQHHDNCQEYRNTILKNAGGKNGVLGCVIEIPYPKTKTYTIYDSGKTYRQAIEGIPLTIDMLRIINNMNGFDFVIMYMYCFDNTKHKEEKRCLYFKPGKISECIKEQNIKCVQSFDIPNAFGLSYKTNVEFPRDMFEINENEISFTEVVTRKE